MTTADSPADLPALVQAADAGDALAARRLFDQLYAELHRMARRELRAGNAELTLGATTLLHEAYLSLDREGLRFPDRARFFAYAARAMRSLVIDRIRARRALKRGGQFHFTEWDTAAVEGALPVGDADGLSEALESLARAEPVLAEVVDLRFFGGLSCAEIAALRGVSERTVQRQWEKARLFLHHALLHG